ncbi:YopX family protein [Streptococcus salivarius]
MIPRFRAWDKEFKEMVRVDALVFDEQIIKTTYKNGNVVKEDLKNYVLMQSTGLKDKNEREIFEGDIVDYKGRKAVIKWHGSYASFIYRFVDELKERAQEWEPLYLSYYHFEVVGNKFENPELLEVSS